MAAEAGLRLTGNTARGVGRCYASAVDGSVRCAASFGGGAAAAIGERLCVCVCVCVCEIVLHSAGLSVCDLDVVCVCKAVVLLSDMSDS